VRDRRGGEPRNDAIVVISARFRFMPLIVGGPRCSCAPSIDPPPTVVADG
jgi:hypothetical protein